MALFANHQIIDPTLLPQPYGTGAQKGENGYNLNGVMQTDWSKKLTQGNRPTRLSIFLHLLLSSNSLGWKKLKKRLRPVSTNHPPV